ncbi:MAG: hypothetical protein GY781_18970, partial [Gammaproteobacteria bacterium]|nr:hypothetical protein [Gammaproteobacteria bacterium]
ELSPNIMVISQLTQNSVLEQLLPSISLQINQHIKYSLMDLTIAGGMGGKEGRNKKGIVTPFESGMK